MLAEIIFSAVGSGSRSSQWMCGVANGSAIPLSPLPTAHCPLPTGHWPLATAHCPLPAGQWLATAPTGQKGDSYSPIEP